MFTAASLLELEKRKRRKIEELHVEALTSWPSLDGFDRLESIHLYNCDLRAASIVLPETIGYFQAQWSLLPPSVDYLVGYKDLWCVTFEICNTVSLRALESYPELCSVTAMGCPLDEWSFFESGRLADDVSLSSETDWRMTCRLFAAGLPIVFRHGQAYVPGPGDLPYIDTSVEELEAYLARPGITWRQIWDDHGLAFQDMLADHLKSTGQTLTMGSSPEE